MKKVLNVGGNNKAIGLPRWFTGWEHQLLDIDPGVAPDVLCDARELRTLPGGTFDAVYCAHNLEHYYRHEVPRVLAGFAHVLKPDGFVHIVVPDVSAVMQDAVKRGLDIGDALYASPAGPITVHDVLYGWAAEIERSGNPFFAHKTGFSHRSLMQVLQSAGYGWVFSGCGNFEVVALAFRGKPTPEYAQLLGLPPSA